MANYSLFISKAPGIMGDLRDDFGLSAVQAAAILGNLGHECNGFRSMQEIRPISGRGGWGWAQWTGPRRRDFEAWCRNQGLDLASDRANYGFLKRELNGNHDYALRALKRESNLVRAVRVFELKYLVAGVKNYPARERYAEIALEAYQGRAGGGVAMIETVATMEFTPDEEALLDDGLGELAAFVGGGLPVHDHEFGDAHDHAGELEAVAGYGGPYAKAEAAEPMIGVLAASEPTIHDTASWGADAASSPIQILNNRPKGIVIHHTASANVSTTTLAHAKQLCRNIQAFHMGPERGWIDTGQNFTVSRGGHILEGRHRSLEIARGGTRHVLGAHAHADCNRKYVGIENEGTYMTGLPPTAQWNALVRLCAWLCNQYSMDTDDIIGHRQCSSTDCPGDAFFDRLSELRADVAAAR